MSFPAFSSGDILTSNDMNAVGMWRITNCGVTSAGGTAATASNGVISIGSANTSVTVTSAFSSDYENYRIVISDVDFSTGGFVRFSLGASGASYYSALRVVYATATADATQKVNNGAYMEIGPQGTTDDTNIVLDVLQPNIATRTGVQGQCTANVEGGFVAGSHASPVAYTSFTIVPSAGNMTGGSIRVYGYRN
jgi:hypothetical protein